MKFRRIGPKGNEVPVVVDSEGTYFDLSPVTTDISGDFLQDNGPQRVADMLSNGELEEIPDASAMRVGAPIARPQAVICVGQNYAAHAAESGSDVPSVPLIFFKHPNTIIGPYDDVLRPPNAFKLDWEVELGIVIGRRARYIDSPEAAAQYIAGYVVSHDVSERHWQVEESGGQWSKGKCGESFNPIGPDLVTRDEIADVQALRLWSRVNGEPRQDSLTADMVFSVDYLVWHLSQYMVLEPGDLINTGTPQGVALSGRFPYLSPGDYVELGIDGLGSQRQNIVQAS
jgi:2-keto-4-pentenoate hydratase/2-oxohepta-3-ene-1,7-dioic acid hydratase in catechol pathway